MVQYFILVRKVGSNNFMGAIPAKKGLSISQIRSGLSGNLKKGLSYSVVSKEGLKNMLKKNIKKKMTKRKTKRRTTTRRKTKKKR